MYYECAKFEVRELSRSTSRLWKILSQKVTKKVTPICEIGLSCDSAIKGLSNSWSFSVPTYPVLSVCQVSGQSKHWNVIPTA